MGYQIYVENLYKLHITVTPNLQGNSFYTLHQRCLTTVSALKSVKVLVFMIQVVIVFDNTTIT